MRILRIPTLLDFSVRWSKNAFFETVSESLVVKVVSAIDEVEVVRSDKVFKDVKAVNNVLVVNTVKVVMVTNVLKALR